LEDSTPPPAASGTFKVTFLVRDVVSQKPQPGIMVRACRRLDVTCPESLTELESTDAAGHVSMDLPAEFDGYLRFEGEGIAPAMYFFDPPVRSDLPDLNVSVASPETAAGLAMLTKAVPDASLGIVLVTVFDCDGAPAEGVTIEAGNVGATARFFYVRNNLPTTTERTTDDTGYGGIVNAATGTVTFSATIDGATVGSVTVLVKPGAMTTARIVPHGI
jgi:hypothetical protein